MFSMNDEVVHTGFDKMSHYIFALANSKNDKTNLNNSREKILMKKKTS